MAPLSTGTRDLSEDITEDKDGGVRKIVVNKGAGLKPLCGDRVTIQYVGFLENGNHFTSNRNFGDNPFSFTIGKGEVMRAWEVALPTMQMGEKCVLHCHHSYLFGAPALRPNTNCLFEIELLSFQGEDLSKKKDGGIRKSVMHSGYSGVDQWPYENALCIISYECYILPASESSLEGGGVDGDGGGVARGDDLESLGFTLVEDKCHLKVVLGDLENVTNGLDRTLRKMREGEKARVVVEAKYAYGSRGCVELNVPADCSLLYVVELHSFVNEKQHWEMSREELLQDAEKERKKGSVCFQEGKYYLARKRYSRSLLLVESIHFLRAELTAINDDSPDDDNDADDDNDDNDDNDADDDNDDNDADDYKDNINKGNHDRENNADNLDDNDKEKYINNNSNNDIVNNNDVDHNKHDGVCRNAKTFKTNENTTKPVTTTTTTTTHTTHTTHTTSNDTKTQLISTPEITDSLETTSIDKPTTNQTTTYDTTTSEISQSTTTTNKPTETRRITTTTATTTTTTRKNPTTTATTTKLRAMLEHRDDLLVAVLLNISLCHLRLRSNLRAYETAERVVSMRPCSLKALYRRGMAHFGMANYAEAREDFKRLLSLQPGNSASLKQLELCERALQEARSKEQGVFSGMFQKFALFDLQKGWEEGGAGRRDVFSDIGQWQNNMADGMMTLEQEMAAFADLPNIPQTDQ